MKDNKILACIQSNNFLYLFQTLKWICHLSSCFASASAATAWQGGLIDWRRRVCRSSTLRCPARRKYLRVINVMLCFVANGNNTPGKSCFCCCCCYVGRKILFIWFWKRWQSVKQEIKLISKNEEREGKRRVGWVWGDGFLFLTTQSVIFSSLTNKFQPRRALAMGHNVIIV